MSVLSIHIVPQGIIFAADRNITIQRYFGNEKQPTSIPYGQTQGSKILKWPNNKAIVGAVGAASLGGKQINEWLYDFIGNNINFSSFNELSESLKDAIQKQREIDDEKDKPQGMLIHLGGFEKRDGFIVPIIYFIRNIHGMDNQGNYTDIRADFAYSEEIEDKFKPLKSSELKNRFKELSEKKEPFWFHHGIGLKIFNILDAFIKQALNTIYINDTELPFPSRLDEWEQHAKMIILTYEAYFQAFKQPWEQYVGGGVDVLSLPWPE